MEDENEMQPETSQEVLKRLMTNVSTNGAEVEFPQDQWGFTRDLRKIGVLTAGSVRGQKDKQDLLLSTLAVLAAHIKKRFDVDAEYELKRQKEIQDAEVERSARVRQAGIPLVYGSD